MRTLLAMLFAFAVGIGQTQSPTYHGGRVLVSGPHIYPIYYGAWSSAAVASSAANLFLSNIGGSSWFADAGAYYDASGVHVINSSLSFPFYIDAYSQGEPVNGVAIINGVQTVSIVQHAISVMGWKCDPDGVYAVIGGAGVENSISYGWHGQFPCDGAQVSFLFASGGNSYVSSHEFIETVTDGLADAWYNSSGYEVADICEFLGQSSYTVVMGGQPILVASYWTGSGCSGGSLTGAGGGGSHHRHKSPETEKALSWRDGDTY